tara:strand:+ start:363 stop:818 length:456 start_codon:yes stop_codon:yes gene_type:complete
MLRTVGSGSGLWPTATANDDDKSPEAHLAMKKRMGERDGTNANRTAITSLQVMAKALWPTPRAIEPGTMNKSKSGGPPQSLKHTAAKMWATPHSSASTGPGTQGRDGGENLQTQVSGQTTPSSEVGGSLNPSFVAWLQGYPPEWLEHAPEK